MIHHVLLGSNGLACARTFYDPVLGLVGLRLTEAKPRAPLYGTGEVAFLRDPDGNKVEVVTFWGK